MVIQICVPLVGKEPNQHVIHLASQVSRTTTVREVPTKSKLGPCTRDEVLAPSDHPARPSSWLSNGVRPTRSAHERLCRPMEECAQGVALTLDACMAWRMSRPAVVLQRLTGDEDNTESLLVLRRLHMARWSTPAHTRQRGRRREVAHRGLWSGSVATIDGEGRQLLPGVLHVEEGIRKPTWHEKGGERRLAQWLTERGSQQRCDAGAVALR
jgi:hypothetical protein